jgi:quinol monooxygenase YgiN
MFARVVEFLPTSEAAAQFVQIVQAKVLPNVKAQPGCVNASIEHLHNNEQVVLGVSVWNSKADAERYHLACYGEIEEMFRPFLKRKPTLGTFEGEDVQRMIDQWDAMVRTVSLMSHPVG